MTFPRSVSDISDPLGHARLHDASLGALVPLFQHYRDAASVHTNNTEDTLYSDALAAGQFAADGDRVSASYAGLIAEPGSGTPTRNLRFSLGGVLMLGTGGFTLPTGGNWQVDIDLMRASPSTVRYIIALIRRDDADLGEAVTAVGEVTGLTLTNTQTLGVSVKVNGAGAAPGDVVATLGWAFYAPAA